MFAYIDPVIILQSRLSGLYFKDFGLWVAHVAEALRFSSLESARQFIASERVSDVTLRNADDAESLLPGASAAICGAQAKIS